MGDYTVAAGSPRSLSYQAGAGITGGQLVALDPATGAVVPAAGAAGYVGVAGNDAGPGDPAATPPVAFMGLDVTVLCGSGVIHETEASGAVTVGGYVTPGAGGTVTSGTQANGIGVALTAPDAAATPPVTMVRWQAYR